MTKMAGLCLGSAETENGERKTVFRRVNLIATPNTMRKSITFVLLILASLLSPSFSAFAEGTRTWEQSSFDQFEKGTSKGVAISSNGLLELAPSFQSMTTTPSTYIWAIAAGMQGDAYAAAGAPARVYHVAPNGKTAVVFQPQELQVQSLVVDPKGVVYAATSPDGKVYRIERQPASGKAAPAESKPAANPDTESVPVDSSYTSSVYFEPGTKYIWALALDRAGNLYVATGDHGEIFRVDPKGNHSLFFKSDEAHIRVLAFDSQDNLIAGSDGSGLIYRISQQGEGFVLYSAPKKEITALAVDDAGNIYAAAVGEKRGPAVSGPAPAPPPNAAPANPGTASPAAPAGGQSATPPAPPPAPPVAVSTGPGSELYQIAADGSPRRIWSSREDVVYALAFDGRGRLLAGTGNKGRIFAIQPDGDFSDLLKASANQVTGFARGANGSLYASTSNLGKVLLIGANPNVEGSYQSDVYDARIFSHWGRVEVRGRGNYELYARSGNVDNPDRNWSPWRKVDMGRDEPINVPSARFIQWKAVLLSGNPAPRIDSVALNYLPKNVAPVIDEISVQVDARGPQNAQNPKPEAGARDRVTVHWSSHDDNDDTLLYSLYYRGDNESRWKLLHSGITEKQYSFEGGLLPDGGYTVLVVASDAPSHSPEDALTDEKESNRFEVDNTPPVVHDLVALVEGPTLHVTFRAADGFSPIRRAEYSLDGGDWQYVEPVGGLSDSRNENYDFNVPVSTSELRVPSNEARSRTKNEKSAQGGPVEPAVQPTVSGEHLIVVRVYDRYDNAGTAKYLIRAR